MPVDAPEETAAEFIDEPVPTEPEHVEPEHVEPVREESPATAPVLTAPAPPAPPRVPPTVTPSRPRPSRARRTLTWIAAGLAVILVVTAVGGYLVYRHLNGNITHLDTNPSILTARPAKLTKAQNILLIGSDTRAFAGGSHYGSEVAGARSDTTILVHLSAGGRKAILVSIPRDSYVQIPACRTTSGGTSAPHMDKFNSAYSIGGPACTISTVESLTHIRVDHFVEVNFQGFQRMVNALGGVNVCIRKPINDPIRYSGGHYIGSGLVLSAGSHTLQGKQALAFVRARYGVGDGSDIGRIKDQQLFISAVIRKATSAGLLVDIPALYSFLDAATKSIRTDPGFGLPQLKSLADRLHGLKPDKVLLLTVPFVFGAPGVPSADVAWDPNRAPVLWDALRRDVALPGEVQQSPGTHASPSPSATAGLTVAPSAIYVRVLNGTGQPGIAHQIAGQLAAQGFHPTSGNALAHNYTTTLVRYGPGRADSAKTLAAAIPGATLQSDPTLGSQVQLVIGSQFGGVVTVPPVQSSPAGSATPSPSPSLDVTTAQQNICSA